jgi:hypothetical protein
VRVVLRIRSVRPAAQPTLHKCLAVVHLCQSMPRGRAVGILAASSRVAPLSAASFRVGRRVGMPWRTSEDFPRSSMASEFGRRRPPRVLPASASKEKSANRIVRSGGRPFGSYSPPPAYRRSRGTRPSLGTATQALDGSAKFDHSHPLHSWWSCLSARRGCSMA